MFRKLNRYWHIVREVDLKSIQNEATTSFPLIVVAETAADRVATTLLLNGAASAANPWLRVVSSDEVQPALAVNGARLALLVTRTGDLPGSLESARALLVARRIPVVTVMVGSFGFIDSISRGGEKKRIVLPSLGEDQREAFANAVFNLVPGDARLSLARQFEGLRQSVFNQLIHDTSRANASYAFSTGLAETVPVLALPIAVGDMLVLTKNQLVMAYRIALAAGKEGRPKDLMGEVIGVVGGGLLARQVARTLIGLVPVLGIVPKVAVAYTGTWAIGHVVANWATGGGEMTRRTLEGVYATGMERGREVARQLSTRRTPHRAA